MAFHVYVEGAVDDSPDGVAKLAAAIAAKFGLPSTDIAARLAAGRFRVKSNVDRATAETFVRALQDLGARAKAEEGAPGSGPIVVPPSKPAAVLPPPSSSGNRTSSPALLPPALPRTTTGNKAQMASGLAAAFSESAPAPADLGALGGESLSLASLDGHEAGAPVSNSFEPAGDAGLPASIGPAALPLAPAKAKATPVDLFAPPDAAEGDKLVELAEEPPKKASSPALRNSEPQLPVPVLGGTVAPSRELSRPMFAAGVLAAILVGFVPAHVVASVRESSAFTEIDNAVNRTQQLATDEQSYAALDSFRSAQLSEKQSKHRSIALTSMLLWAVIGAGLAYLWFRRIPWHKLLKS